MRAGADQISDLRSRKGPVAKIMIALDQFVPEGGLPASLHHSKGQLPEGAAGHAQCGFRIGGLGGLGPMSTVYIVVARWRQLKDTVTMHTEHGNPARHLLEAAVRFDPAEVLAGSTGKAGAGEFRVLFDEPVYPDEFFRGEIPSTVPQRGGGHMSSSYVCAAHAAKITEKESCVQQKKIRSLRLTSVARIGTQNAPQKTRNSSLWS
jgi:hypothetical protein